jgi:hypothetical protein
MSTNLTLNNQIRISHAALSIAGIVIPADATNESASWDLINWNNTPVRRGYDEV